MHGLPCGNTGGPKLRRASIEENTHNLIYLSPPIDVIELDTSCSWHGHLSDPRCLHSPNGGQTSKRIVIRGFTPIKFFGTSQNDRLHRPARAICPRVAA